MKRKNLRVLFYACGLLLIVVGVFLFYSMEVALEQNDLIESAEASNNFAGGSNVDSGSLLSTKANKEMAGVDTVEVSGCVEQYTISQLSEKSTLVVYGEVTYIHEPILVKSAAGNVSVHTDVDITPEQVFRGEAEETITLRLPGGLIEREYVEYLDAPELQLHQSYLFFLYRSDKGNGVYTRGGQYYLTGMSQGVFLPDSQKFSAELKFLNCYMDTLSVVKQQNVESLDEILAEDAIFSAEELTAMYEVLNKSVPVDENKSYREAQENIRSNLENGVITREAYEEDMANLEQYAEEITPEEAEEIARQNEAEKEKLRQLLSQEE